MTIEKKKLLIIEDDKKLARSLAERFEAEDYIVIRSTTLAETNFKLTNDSFACILMDLRIEGGRADRIIDHLNENEVGPNFKTPIIVVSGNVEKDFLTLYRTRIAGILVKPYDVEKLVAQVNGLISQKI